MEIQTVLGSDIAMIFDECLSYTTDIDATKKSMELSNYWAYKSKKSFGNSANKLFGIIQGGFHLIYVKNH